MYFPVVYTRNPDIDITIQRRREWVFLILAGLFLGSLAMLNILGVSRFIDLTEYVGLDSEGSFKFIIAIGVLPYPITFLCTDIISEIYGRRRANLVVWMGLILNLWVLLIIWFGGWLNAPSEMLPDGTLPINVVEGDAVVPHGYAFYEMRQLTFSATLASMIAYLSAQFIDVQVFHFLKEKTGGRRLWLRNNLSTLTSQLIDSIAVILITHYLAGGLPVKPDETLGIVLIMYILSSYLFKFAFALFDTIPIYIAVRYLRKYLDVEDELSY